MTETIETSAVPSSLPNDPFQIPIKIHQPSQFESKLKSIVFFIHGGIFTHGSMHCHPTIARSLTHLNNVVITASFRNGTEAPWKSGVTMSDLKDVLHWIDRERQVRQEWSNCLLGLVGSSSVSGGHWLLRDFNTCNIHFPYYVCF